MTSAIVRAELRAAPSNSSALAVLTGSVLRAGLREGQFAFAALSPVIFFLCLYTPMHRRFEAGTAAGNYAQYVAPVIIVQAVLFAAIVSAEVAGEAARHGTRERLASLPIRRTDPLVARMAGAVVRALVAVATSTGIAAAFGFRFSGSAVDIVGFIALPAMLVLVLSLLTDALASSVAHPDSVAQSLTIPALVLVVLSTGLVPAGSFPSWIRGFVTHQPISLAADAMRGLSTGGSVRWGELVAWLVGLSVAGVFAARAAGRKAVR